MPTLFHVDGCDGALSREARRAVEEALRSGNLIVYPTDTVYGLGCNPSIEEAVGRIFEIKRRPSNRPLPLLVTNLEAAERIAVFDDVAYRLASKFWPGALTLVLRARVPRPLRGNTIGVRIPNCRPAVEVAEAAGGAIIGTSANVSGTPPPRMLSETLDQLGPHVSIAVDGGVLPGIPSTVLDLSGQEQIILREGALPSSNILEVLR